jgi:hypothetical protein
MKVGDDVKALSEMGFGKCQYKDSNEGAAEVKKSVWGKIPALLPTLPLTPPPLASEGAAVRSGRRFLAPLLVLKLACYYLHSRT